MKQQKAVQPGKLVLGIETATVLGSVALVSTAGELIGECTLRNHESHSERILPALEGLLRTLGAALDDLSAVAVSRGPGSFTGLRAGIASAKGLSFSLGVPLFGVSTLQALAANAPPREGPVCAVLAARRGEVFRALFRCGPSGPERIGSDGLIPFAGLAAELTADTLVIGDLPPAFPTFPRRAGTSRFAAPHLCHPRAAVIAGFGARSLGESRESELSTLLPLYLRACDAVPVRSGA